MTLLSPGLLRWCTRAALLGGALSVGEGFLILSDPGYYNFDSITGYLVLVVEGAALLAVMGGLVGIHIHQRRSYGRLGTAGFLAAVAGTVLAGAGHLGAVAFFDFVNTGGIVYVLVGLGQGLVLVGGLAYVPGILAMSAGYVLLGVATWRAGTLPRWSGVVLVAGLAGLWLGNAGGWIAFGLAWILMGATLHPADKKASAGQTGS